MWRNVILLILLAVVTADDTKNIHSPCKILLNEVSPTTKFFVEVGKFCVRQKKNDQTSLAGYHLLVVDTQDLRLVLHKSLEKTKLTQFDFGVSTGNQDLSLQTSRSETKGDDGARNAVDIKGGATGISAKGSTAGSLPRSEITAPPAPTTAHSSQGVNSKTSTVAQKPVASMIPIQSTGQHTGVQKEARQLSKGSYNTITAKTNSGATSSPEILASPAIPASPAVPASLAVLASHTAPGSSVVNAMPATPDSPPAPITYSSSRVNGEGTQTTGTSTAHTNLVGEQDHSDQQKNAGGPVSKGTGQVSQAPSNIPNGAISTSKITERAAEGKSKTVPDQQLPSDSLKSKLVAGLSPIGEGSPATSDKGMRATASTPARSPMSPTTKGSPSSCSTCPSPSKKLKRVKRYTERKQENIWGAAHVFLDLVLDEDKTYAVILLYLPYCRRTRIWDKYEEGKPLKEEARGEISSYAQDVLIIASETTQADLGMLMQLLPSEYDIPTVSASEPITDYSFSKCDAAISAFNEEGFVLSQRTPGAPNICPFYDSPQPFSFRGKVLKAQTQELVVNVVTNLQFKMADEAWRQLSAVDAAAEILNLSKKTVSKIMKKFDDGDAFTDGKKRDRTKPTTDLDDKQKEILYQCITEPYKENRVPRFVNIWKCFVERVRRHQLEELELEVAASSVLKNYEADDAGGTADDRTTLEDGRLSSGNLYHCSAWSFSKILDKYGYNYGKIRNRDAQIFRPAIIKWRKKYIEAIKKYENDPNWNVVYQDETWIDPHQRPSRGWVKRTYDNFKQRMDFTFKDDKISRGNRLIILAAGGKDGFIHEATEVYAVPVKRKNSCKAAEAGCSDGLAEDYHDNVKGPKFLKWLEGLFKHFKDRPTVFVMDNCPFHKVLGVPKKADLKESIRKWLEEKKNEGYSISQDVSPSTKLTKAQLLSIVDQLTDESSGADRIPRTQIQQLANTYGHRILHIPPYNCELNPIEYVWNDIKNEVKEENTEQTVKYAMELAKRKLSVYPAEEWRKKISHVRKREDTYLEGDKVFVEMQDEASAEPLTEEDLASIEKEAEMGVSTESTV